MYHSVVSPTKRASIPKCGLQQRGGRFQPNVHVEGTRGFLLPPVLLGVGERVIQPLHGMHSEMRSPAEQLGTCDPLQPS